MALVYRVNINFSPLLITFHCKCMMNITRFKSMFRSNTNNLDNNITRYHFKNMIDDRQAQASRSILIKLPKFEVMDSIKNFCSRYGKIRNIFPYITMNQKYFVLIEFHNNETVECLRKIAPPCNNEKPQMVHIVSPTFQYINEKVKIMPSMITEVTSASEFVAPDMEKITNVLKSKYISISDQMFKLHDLVKIKELDIRLRFYTAEQLTFYLSKLFTNLDIVPFGSSATGFGQTGCDLDLLCNISSVRKFDKGSDTICRLAEQTDIDIRANQIEFLTVLHRLIKLCIPGIHNMQAVLRAHVPILKFTNYNTNMECDLSSANQAAFHMSEILYIYGMLDYRVKPLVCTIRKWAEVKRITKSFTGCGITNFFLTVLVIFYLQVERVLPSIEQVQNVLKYRNSVMMEELKTKNYDSLENLLFQFFHFYCSFDFDSKAICIKHGMIKTKPTKDSPIFMYNPFSQFVNISKNVSKPELRLIKKHFQNALDKLTTDNTQNGILRLFEEKLNAPVNKIISNNLQKQSNSQSNNTKVLEKINSQDIEKVKNVIK